MGCLPILAFLGYPRIVRLSKPKTSSPYLDLTRECPVRESVSNFVEDHRYPSTNFGNSVVAFVERAGIDHDGVADGV